VSEDLKSKKEKETTSNNKEKSNKEKNNKLKSIFSKNNIFVLILGVLIGIIIGYVIFTVALKSAIKDIPNNLQSTSYNVGESSVSTDELTISTYTEPHNEILFGTDERNNIKQVLLDGISDIQNGPCYTQLQLIDGSYLAYMYNTSGEIFVQDENFEKVEVILNNSKGFAFNTSTSDMTMGEDEDALSFLYKSVLALDNENIKLFEMTHDEAEDDLADVKEYRIDIVGEDAVRSLYSDKSSDFVDTMMTNLRMQVSNIDQNWEPHIITAFQIDNKTNKILSAASVLVANNNEYNNFIMMGYDKTDDWKLPDEWYSYDPNNDADGTEFISYFDKTSQIITDVLHSYAESQGWDLSATPNVEDSNTEVTPDTTSESDVDSLSENENAEQN